uniref:S-acyl fatty acid synthase thioesterase, medium chain n=1 Tax=Oryzias latipes TaxID=8090 RepID=A0A3P9IZD5_ORYLA
MLGCPDGEREEHLKGAGHQNSKLYSSSSVAYEKSMFSSNPDVMLALSVFALKLPGRETRFREPFFQNMEQIVEEVVAALLPMLDEKPFALFGHSFGALTSFAVAEHLKKQHNVEPVHMFLSGAPAPFSEIRLKSQRRSELSDEDFLRWLSSMGGTPPELLANPEVLQFFLPALKADLHVVENYRCARPEHPLLHCSLSCLDGKDDLPHNLQEWRCITSGEFTIKMFDGAHFYLKDPGNEKLLLDHMLKHLEASQLDYL